MSHVAIIHGPREFSLGNALRRELEAGGVRCWFGARDLLAGAPTLDGQRDAVREARVVVVVVPPGEGPHASYIEDALQAARYGAVVVPVPAGADAGAAQGPFADAVARIRAGVAGAPPPPTERVVHLPSTRSRSRGHGALGVALPVLAAALVSAGILALWSAAPTTVARLARQLKVDPVVNIAHLRAAEVAVTGMRSNQGWTLMLHLRDPAKRVEYRLDSMSDFESTGTNDGLRDHDTLEPMAKTWLSVGQLTHPITLDVRFTDKDGKLHGPFKLRFDPIAEEVRTTRSSLSERGERWIDVLTTGGTGPLAGKTHAYFSLLLWHKPAFRALRYGFDTKRPDTQLFFTPDDFGKHHERDQDRVNVPAGARFISIDIEFKDGSHLKREFPVDRTDRG